MNSRTRKSSKSPHKAASTPNIHSETKLTQKKLRTYKKNSDSQCLETPVKNYRENYVSPGTGAVKDDSGNSEKSRLYYSSDEDQDDIDAIFEHKVSKSIQSFSRNSEVNLKERRFFKRSFPESLNHSICLSPRTVELQEENVSKVFKILSKSVSTPNFSESKPIRRLPLKTYSTPRTPKTSVIESFGLPDTPILPSFPPKYDDLDVGVTDAKDVTVCDMPFFEVDEVIPLKQYEKGISSNVNKIQIQDEALSTQINTSPDHKTLIEKMKNQIRKLLSESPTRSKEKITSTPIKTNKPDMLNCDESCIEDNSLDMEIFNTTDKTGILFTLPDWSQKEKKKVKKKSSPNTLVSFRRKLRSSESGEVSNKTDDSCSLSESSDQLNKSENKNKNRSNSKKTENKSADSSPNSDLSVIINKRQTRSFKHKKLHSTNNSLELKILLNPLSENVLSNYSVYQNLSKISLKDNLQVCQQFLEHEKQSLYPPLDSNIVCSILGDWENIESEVYTPENSQTPNKLRLAYEYKAISPDKITEKLTYKKKCRSAVALISAQDDLSDSPKQEIEQSDTKEVQREFHNNKSKNEVEDEAVPKEEIKPQEENNFSVIQYTLHEESSKTAKQQEILIFETTNNLELVVNKDKLLMNGTVNESTSKELKNDQILFSDGAETNCDKKSLNFEDPQNLYSSLSDGTQIINEPKDIVDEDANNESEPDTFEEKQDTLSDSSNNNKCQIICDKKMSKLVSGSLENKPDESNIELEQERLNITKECSLPFKNHTGTSSQISDHESAKSQNQSPKHQVNIDIQNDKQLHKPHLLNGLCENSLKDSILSNQKTFNEPPKGIDKSDFKKQLDIILVNANDFQFQYPADLKQKRHSKTSHIKSVEVEKSAALELQTQIIIPHNTNNDSIETCHQLTQELNRESPGHSEASVEEQKIVDNNYKSSCSGSIILDQTKESHNNVENHQSEAESSDHLASDLEEVCTDQYDSHIKRKRMKKPYFKCRSSTRLEKSPITTDTENEVLENVKCLGTKKDMDINDTTELKVGNKEEMCKDISDNVKGNTETSKVKTIETVPEKNVGKTEIVLSDFKKQLDVILLNGHDLQSEYLEGLNHKKYCSVTYPALTLDNRIVEQKNSENDCDVLKNNEDSVKEPKISSSLEKITSEEKTQSPSSIIEKSSSEAISTIILQTNSDEKVPQSADSPMTENAAMRRKSFRKPYFKCRSSTRLEKFPFTGDVENNVENSEYMCTGNDNEMSFITNLKEKEAASQEIPENLKDSTKTPIIDIVNSEKQLVDAKNVEKETDNTIKEAPTKDISTENETGDSKMENIKFKETKNNAEIEINDTQTEENSTSMNMAILIKKGRPHRKSVRNLTDVQLNHSDGIDSSKANESYSSQDEDEVKTTEEKVANITDTLIIEPNYLIPAKNKGRPRKKSFGIVSSEKLNNSDSERANNSCSSVDDDEVTASGEKTGEANNTVGLVKKPDVLISSKKRGRPRKKNLNNVANNELTDMGNSTVSSKANDPCPIQDETAIIIRGEKVVTEDRNNTDNLAKEPDALIKQRKRGRPRKIRRKKEGGPQKLSNIQEIESKERNNSHLADFETQNTLVTASPKTFEGFEKAEKTEDFRNVTQIHTINLEQIEAELVAIEYQKNEDEFEPLFTKLTRSKSRAALKDVKDDINLNSGESVNVPRRSKTSLGLLLKNSVDQPRRSKVRQRTIGTVEGGSSNDSRKRSRSVVSRMFQNEKKKRDTFNLGTIAWARVGGHPFWPCLVTKEPGNNVFKRDSITAGSMKTIYHVRFFGDKGKRAWVVETKMMLYNEKNDVELLLKKAKEENKPLHERLPYLIRPSYVEKWKKAVNEAEQLKGSALSEKIKFFEQIDIRRRLEKLAKKNDHDLPGTSKRKRKDSISTISSETSQITDFQDESPTRKRYKKDETSRAANELEKYSPSTKVKNLPEPTEPEPVVIPPYVPILDNENILPSRTRSGLHSEVNSEIIPKAVIIPEKPETPPDPFSIESQKSLFRRNNLFKGVSKEKACQYCYQPDMVFKCSKGGCNGLYHLQCSIDVMTGEEYNKKKNKKKSIGQSTVIELNPKDNDPNTMEAPGTNPPDDRVQIVTVTSHIYNTPPRKTFPENFQAMSLAEQIDFKMKEVMKKFENQTRYAESSTDSGSEESNVAKMISMIKNSPNVKLSFDNLTTNKISDGKFPERPNGKLPDVLRKHRNSIVKHVTADSVIETSSDESSPNSSRHVTADSVVIEKLDKGKTLLKKLVTTESDLERTPSESSCSTVSLQSKETLDPKTFKCGFCLSHLEPYCFVCHQAVTVKGSAIRQKCSLYQCGRYYHPECLKLWPQTQWSFIQTTKHRTSKEEFDTFVCPQHVCHTCSSDDPRAATSRCSGDKIVKCLRCPSSYHSTNYCIPAGTDIISTTQVICPRHRNKKKNTINTTWCFLCSEGGNLICCETCPTSVHPECMPVNLTDDDKFICEDCESGRLPLYDEIVWVKLGAFRWWPALILFPNEVPPNVMNARHSAGEFVVRFFGTYDHYWVSRSRSFLFQDGDAGQTTSTKKKVDAAFNRAVEEAVVAHKAKKEFKRTREVESLNSLKPPPYIRIKVNRPVGNVRHMDLDLSSTTSCDCDPHKPNPCEPDSDCLNRLLMTECNPEVCPAGQRCKNQSFEKREYPPMTPYKTEGRGWGLRALAPIKKGQFVIEYVGELIDMEEYQRRILKMHEQKEENYYFLTIDKDRMIDAGPKGNLARFMNHCCQPNCETQKWTVNGDTRVGLFATVDIPAETELTFNYNLECVGKERKICRCGAPSCSGFIGVQKEKQESDVKKMKKIYKKKKPVEPAVLPPCFICQRKGNVGLCNNKVCNKAYHLRCLNMTEWPEGNKFVCPWHNCNNCSKRTIRCCVKCINSFCPSHSEGNIRYDNLLGFVCSSHDPTKQQSDNPVRMKSRRSHVITEESAVTSTTSDDSEKEDEVSSSDRLKTDRKEDSDSDYLPLSVRVKKGRKRTSNHTSSGEFEVSNSTSLSDVQDEHIVSSATPSGSEESRKKKSVKRNNDQTRKKIRLSNLVNNKRKSTARCNSNSRQLDDR